MVLVVEGTVFTLMFGVRLWAWLVRGLSWKLCSQGMPRSFDSEGLRPASNRNGADRSRFPMVAAFPSAVSETGFQPRVLKAPTEAEGSSRCQASSRCQVPDAESSP